jgi:hypothetical protein
MPPIKVAFEQKYIIRMILAVVINAWRSFQLLSESTDLALDNDYFCLDKFKKSMSNHTVTLKEFNINLALGLIRSADNAFFQNVLFSEKNNAQQVVQVANAALEDLGFERNPTTLTERLRLVKWPKRYRLETFCKK